jgi:hypothetical protein
MSLFLGGRNTKIKRASSGAAKYRGAAKHRGAAKYRGPYPHRHGRRFP